MNESDTQELNRREMSLRDYFAAKVLTGLTYSIDSNNEHEFFYPNHKRKDGLTVAQKMAEICYVLADAMFEARKGGHNE